MNRQIIGRQRQTGGATGWGTRSEKKFLSLAFSFALFCVRNTKALICLAFLSINYIN